MMFLIGALAVFALICLCGTYLGSLAMKHEHEMAMNFNHSVTSKLIERVSALESARSEKFDPVAFDDLKSKVDALRIAQGLKRG